MDAKEARAYLNGSTAYSNTSRRTRGPLIVCGVAAVVFFTLFFSTSSVSEVSTIARDAAHNLPSPHIPHLQDLRNPFKTSPHHKPPIQSNSSSGSTKWYSDLKWLNPFSSSATFDESRVVLPPLKERPTIYTYYDSPPDRGRDVEEEERKILTSWRKAWWAQGFKPVILGPKEAIQNSLYESLKTQKMEENVKKELMRWLAWGWMGPGILTNWLLLPMAPWNDADLIYLRTGDYGRKLVRYETMGSNIYASPTMDEINKAVKAVIENPKLDKQTSLQDAIPDPHAFTVQVQPFGIALYDMHTISSTFPSITTELKNSEVAGLNSLQLLMTSHLHGTFLEQFSAGIQVLNSESVRTTILASLTTQLANILNTCPNTPMPLSCPPNRPSCRPCKPGKITYGTEISNTTDVFKIGLVPHPYTFALLQVSRSDIDVPWVRRFSERDLWITRITNNLSKGLSAYNRITAFKNLIANDDTRHSFIWHTAEQDWKWKDLEWHFGFTISAPENEKGNKGKVMPSPEALKPIKPRPDADPVHLVDLLRTLGTKRPTRAALVEQAVLVTKATEVLMQEKFKGPIDMRTVIEAWNLADTEAWRFVGALTARERVQRERWEEEEKRFVGG